MCARSRMFSDIAMYPTVDREGEDGVPNVVANVLRNTF